MKRKVKGILGVVLSIAMIVSLTPGMVFAAEETDLLADMYVDTAGNDVVTADLNESLNVTAELDVQPVKDELEANKTQILAAAAQIAPNAPEAQVLSAVTVSGVTGEFELTFTADEGLTLPTDTGSYKLSSDVFKPKSLEGNKLTLELAKDYKTFGELYNDVSAIASPMTLEISGVTPTVEGETLTLTATVNGTLKGTASIVNPLTGAAVRTKDIDKSWTGKKFGNPEIKITVYAAKALDGDMLVEGETENKEVYEATAGDKLTYSATLDVSPVKARMKAIEEQFAGVDTSKITIDPFAAEFKAAFTPDEGLTLPSDEKAYRLTGSEDFEIAVEGNTVTFTLAKEIKDYTTLKAVADAMADKLTLEFPVEVAKDATGQKTIKGSIDGSMKATAKYNSQTRNFDEAWTAAQTADGVDFVLASAQNPEIQVTINVTPKEPSVLEGDLKVEDDTEHNAVYPATAGTKLNYQAVLNVKSVREEMAEIEAKYEGVEFGQIKLDPIASVFTVEFTVPEGLTLPASADDFKLTGTDAFDVAVSGSTVTMTLKSDITDYAALKDKLGDAEELTLDFPVEVAATASGQLTLGVKVTGTFEATATYRNKSLSFDEAWTAVQTEDGVDKILEGQENPEIQLTIDVSSALDKEDHFSYIIGYEDHTVRPEANITRAETSTIFFRLLKDEVRKSLWSSDNDFDDVNKPDWFNNAVSTLANGKILRGYPEGDFRPNNTITRAEVATIIARFESGQSGDASIEFSDIGGHWAENEINQAASLGYFVGNGDGKFRPNDPIKRDELITAINRVLGRISEPEEEPGLLDEMQNTFSDNQPGAWYYAAVQEATNSHKYTIDENGNEIWTAQAEDRDWAALEREGATPDSSSNPGDVKAPAIA